MNFLTAIFIAVGALAGIALTSLYVGFIHDPQVIANARQGYVEIAEKTAAEAKSAELERQRNAASQALTDNEKRKTADDLVNQAREAQSNLEVSQYEAALVAAKRSCFIDDDDRRFLLNH